MVCLGNICRSPMAEGILRETLKKAKIKNIEVDSCGTSAWHVGEAPDKRAQTMCKKHGIDIRNLRGRQFIYEDFSQFDLIYAMDYDNFLNITAMSKNSNDLKKVKMILNESFPNSDMSVPDPYYGGNDGFNKVFSLLKNACDKIVEQIATTD